MFNNVVERCCVRRRCSDLAVSVNMVVVRVPRSTRLTNDGQALVGVARTMEAQAYAIVRHLQGHSIGAPVTVTASALRVLAAFLIAYNLHAFAQDTP